MRLPKTSRILATLLLTPSQWDLWIAHDPATYCPDPKLDRNLVWETTPGGRVLQNTVLAVAKKIIESKPPIAGIPAAIAVNLGKKLSHVWDTTECRLLYAWTDGFLDMKNYWGDKAGGRRKGFAYVPELYGFSSTRHWENTLFISMVNPLPMLVPLSTSDTIWMKPNNRFFHFPQANTPLNLLP